MKKPHSQPATQFAWSAVEPDEPDVAAEEAGGRAYGRLVFDAFLALVLGSKISRKKIAARALALAIVAGWHGVRNRNRRELAKSIDVSHTTLNQSVAEVRRIVRAMGQGVSFQDSPPLERSKLSKNPRVTR